MNKYFNILRIRLTFISSLIFLLEPLYIDIYFIEKIPYIIIFNLMIIVTLIDIYKKRQFNIKHNVIIIFIILIILFQTFRPLFDAYLFVNNSKFILDNIKEYLIISYSNNQILITLLFIIIIILNYIDFKLEE